MKNLGNLSPAKGSNRPNKRLGRGIGSGLGKTGGKGHKGQLARKGGKVRGGFEGGQTPLYRRLPKVGFTNIFATEYNIINLDALDQFAANSRVTVEELAAAGLLRHPENPVKLLGKGKIAKVLTVVVHKTSKSARAAIEGAGGKIEEI